MRAATIRLIPIVLVLGLPAAFAAPPSRSLHPDDRGGRIQFDEPRDWRCTSRQPCLTCRNVSGHDSTIVIVRGAGPAERHAVPGGSALQICSDGAGDPGPSAEDI